MSKSSHIKNEQSRVRTQAGRVVKVNATARDGNREVTKASPSSETPKPWAKRPKPPRGDAAEQETYAAVGKALSSWSLLEMTMTGLFITFIDAKGDYIPLAAKSFGAVRTFEGRRDIIDVASVYFFDIARSRCKEVDVDGVPSGIFDTIEKDYKKLSVDMSNAVSRRNEIAHGIVSVIWLENEHGEGFVLQATPMDRKTDKFSVSQHSYDSKSLLHYASAFEGLHDRAHNINFQLRVLMTTLEEAKRG